MGLKYQKGKQSSPNKQPVSPRPWPDFPKQILDVIGKQPSLMKNIFFGGFTKSWRKVHSKKCNPIGNVNLPQLMEYMHGDSYESNSTRPCILNISFRHGSYWYYSRSGKNPNGFVCPIEWYSHGCLFFATGSEYHLYDPYRKSTWSIPPWDGKVPLKYAAMSKDPKEKENRLMLAVTGTRSSDLVFCGFNYYKLEWSKQQSTIVDPYSLDKQLMQFTNIMGYKGKFYALSLQGALAVIEVIESQIRITGIGSSRAVPSVPSKHFKEFLIESEGEILLVLLIYKNSIQLVDEVEIYHIEFERISWVKMAGLGDRTLFVGTNCCISVASSKVGCKSNCVYFTHQGKDDDWWVYDMEKSKIGPGWNCTDSTAKSPEWNQPISEECE